MLLYLLWNRHMEMYSDIRYRIESVSVRDLCRLAGYTPSLCSQEMHEIHHSPEPMDNSSLRFQHLFEQLMISMYKKLHLKEENISHYLRSRKLFVEASKHDDAYVEKDYLEKDFPLMMAGSRLQRSIKLLKHQNYTAKGSTQEISKPKLRLELDWRDLDQHDQILANEVPYHAFKHPFFLLLFISFHFISGLQIRIMCLEYGFPLDLKEIPQSNETFRFTA